MSVELSKEAIRAVRKLLNGDSVVDFPNRVAAELDAAGLWIQTDHIRGEGRSRWMHEPPKFHLRAVALGIVE